MMDDENVECKRCGRSITDTHTFYLTCECGCTKWEYNPDSEFGEKP